MTEIKNMCTCLHRVPLVLLALQVSLVALDPR